MDARDVLVAWEVSDVPGVLADLEDAVRAEPASGRPARGGDRAGLVAAGFLAYEAAPAFDPALCIRASPGGSIPLAWFGLFGRREAVDPLQPPRAACDPPWVPEMGEEEHARAVEAIREAIAGGWSCQVNLTQRLGCDFSGDPFDLYRRLAIAQAGAYCAYFEADSFAVASASPELFFSLDDRVIVTRPMKGTAPRGRFPAEDESTAAALRTSDKERAENLMIVDLMRNDVGRIAVPGTVTVPEMFTCERYPTLWQLTSTVRAQLPASTRLADVFAALFPCGSVTGVPKASTMALIAAQESSPRGVYCGAAGWVAAGDEGLSARFSVAIRTATIDKSEGRARYGTGGAITYDSDPRGEWEELLAKATPLGNYVRPAGLFETMRYSEDGGLRNLDRHLARVASSAGYFGMEFRVQEAMDQLAEETAGLEGVWRVRLAVDGEGTTTVHCEPLDAIDDGPVLLAIDDEPVDTGDVRVFHKTVDRSLYESRRARHPEADDVVLVNGAGEVTETVRANLAVLLGGHWWTPPVTSGLLAGVERGRLLDEGSLKERAITREDLSRAEGLATVSSLRGWLVAELGART